MRYHTDPKRRRDACVRDATHKPDTRTTRARRRAASAATQSATREPTRRTTQNDLARDDGGDRAERTRANPRAPTTRAERAGVDVGADAGRTTIGDRRRRRGGARTARDGDARGATTGGDVRENEAMRAREGSDATKTATGERGGGGMSERARERERVCRRRERERGREGETRCGRDAVPEGAKERG